MKVQVNLYQLTKKYCKPFWFPKKKHFTILRYNFLSNLLIEEMSNNHILTPITIYGTSSKYDYYTMNRFQLKTLIEIAIDRVRNYYTELLTQDVSHKNEVIVKKIFLLSIYLSGGNQSMVINLDKSKPFISNSDLLEYDIFNLVSLYKMFDWKRQKLILEFY